MFLFTAMFFCYHRNDSLDFLTRTAQQYSYAYTSTSSPVRPKGTGVIRYSHTSPVLLDSTTPANNTLAKSTLSTTTHSNDNQMLPGSTTIEPFVPPPATNHSCDLMFPAMSAIETSVAPTHNCPPPAARAGGWVNHPKYRKASPDNLAFHMLHATSNQPPVTDQSTPIASENDDFLREPAQTAVTVATTASRLSSNTSSDKPPQEQSTAEIISEIYISDGYDSDTSEDLLIPMEPFSAFGRFRAAKSRATVVEEIEHDQSQETLKTTGWNPAVSCSTSRESKDSEGCCKSHSRSQSMVDKTSKISPADSVLGDDVNSDVQENSVRLSTSLSLSLSDASEDDEVVRLVSCAAEEIASYEATINEVIEPTNAREPASDEAADSSLSSLSCQNSSTVPRLVLSSPVSKAPEPSPSHNRVFSKDMSHSKADISTTVEPADHQTWCGADEEVPGWQLHFSDSESSSESDDGSDTETFKMLSQAQDTTPKPISENTKKEGLAAMAPHTTLSANRGRLSLTRANLFNTPGVKNSKQSQKMAQLNDLMRVQTELDAVAHRLQLSPLNIEDVYDCHPCAVAGEVVSPPLRQNKKAKASKAPFAGPVKIECEFSTPGQPGATKSTSATKFTANRLGIVTRGQATRVRKPLLDHSSPKTPQLSGDDDSPYPSSLRRRPSLAWVESANISSDSLDIINDTPCKSPDQHSSPTPADRVASPSFSLRIRSLEQENQQLRLRVAALQDDLDSERSKKQMAVAKAEAEILRLSTSLHRWKGLAQKVQSALDS